MTNKANENYDALVADIMRMMEQGTAPWQHPVIKQAGGLPVRHNGEPYSGINVLSLWVSSIQNGFSGRHWMTYKQAKELGGQVKRGSKSTVVFYFNTVKRENDAGEEYVIPFMKCYNVFNTAQIDGLPDRYTVAPDTLLDNPPSAPLDAFFAATGSIIEDNQSASCHYNPTRDIINMPDIKRFRSSQVYYATLAHEHVHWTGAKHRLDRTFGKKFGDPRYAFEELVAELGSAFLMSDLGVMPCDTASHASYLENWLQALRDDRSQLRKAASHASKAVAYMHSQQEQQALAA